MNFLNIYSAKIDFAEYKIELRDKNSYQFVKFQPISDNIPETTSEKPLNCAQIATEKEIEELVMELVQRQ
jgi:hypothetical protein